MIKKALVTDISEIMSIVKESIAIMNGDDNPQWDDEYPGKKDFMSDIVCGDLYVYIDGQSMAGIMCINLCEPSEYEDIQWKSGGDVALVIHRMAVSPHHRGKGVGSKLFMFAEEKARKNHIKYLKSDTYGTNLQMNSLLKKLGYLHVGYLNFKGKSGKFNCYEKILFPHL